MFLNCHFEAPTHIPYQSPQGSAGSFHQTVQQLENFALQKTQLFQYVLKIYPSDEMDLYHTLQQELELF